MKLETTKIFKNLKSKNSNLIEIDDETLKILQNEILSIAKDVIGLCEKENISYHLTGGSALGAVRHNGFIPWDDDLDIDMERKDIKRFLNIFSDLYGGKYWIHSYESDENFCIPCIQIRKKGTVCRGILDSTDEECGIYIDVAIIENTYNNAFRRKFHGCVSLALGLITSCRRFYRDRNYLLSLTDDKDTLKVFKSKIRIGRICSFFSLRKWTNLYNKWNSKCKDNNTTYVTVPSGRNHFFGELYKREDFAEYSRHDFEGMSWKIPKNYDSYLKHMYGDYMQIPQGNDREKHVLLGLEFIEG